VQVGKTLNLTTGHVFQENVVPLLPDSLKICNKFTSIQQPYGLCCPHAGWCVFMLAGRVM